MHATVSRKLPCLQFLTEHNQLWWWNPSVPCKNLECTQQFFSFIEASHTYCVCVGSSDDVEWEQAKRTGGLWEAVNPCLVFCGKRVQYTEEYYEHGEHRGRNMGIR